MNLSNENVIHINNGKVQYLQFRKLLEYKDKINHAYSLGVENNFRTAKPNKERMSIQAYNKAIYDYKMLCNNIGSNYENLVKTNQEHTNNVKIVERKINLNEPDFNLKEYKKTDGLITNKRNLVLSTTNADCILLLFYDPVKNIIANVHSGWKGTLQRIAIKTIKKMYDEFNCNMNDIIVCICPSIRKCHFEVEQDVRDMFINEFKNLENIQNIIEETVKDKKWNIDIVEINKRILIKEGIMSENIIDSGICSVCNCNTIHSYRVEKQGYGLETALIELK